MINTDFLLLAGFDAASDRLKLRITVLFVAQVHARSELDIMVLDCTMLLLLQVAAPRSSPGV